VTCDIILGYTIKYEHAADATLQRVQKDCMGSIEKNIRGEEVIRLYPAFIGKEIPKDNY